MKSWVGYRGFSSRINTLTVLFNQAIELIWIHRDAWMVSCWAVGLYSVSTMNNLPMLG